MATHLNIPSKYEGSTLSSSEFNALVTAINENATSVENLYEQLKDKLDIAEIKVDANTTIRILSVKELIEYINEYGTATDVYNTPPVIKIKQTTYIYNVGEELSFDIELYDVEGGELTITGTNPTVTNGYNTFTITGLRSGTNTIDLNQLVYNNTTSKLPVGTYNFKEIFVIDKLGRSSISPVNILIIVGNISLISAFDSTYSYKPNTAISVRYGISSITNTNKITYKLTGKMLIDDGVLDLYYQSFSEVSEVIDSYKLTANDEDFITGNVYYINYILPLFENIGDYTLSITVEGLGEVSTPLLVNIVVNKDGVLYSATTFDVNGSYYAGDSISIPVNIFYNLTDEVDYTYKCNAWIDGLPITGESDLTAEQKNILLKLTLPDDPDLYTIKFKTTIITPSNEVYKTNINYVAVQAKLKSKYAVLTDSSSKLELYLTGKGKSNASPNWLTWENRYNLDLKYFGSLYNFSKVVNGWEELVDGVSYYGDTLSASGDAYCYINYKPFENFDTKKEDLTIEFSIRHGDLVSDLNYNLSIGKPNSYPQKGIYVKNYSLIINGLNSTINIPLICDNKVLTKMGEWVTGDEYAHVFITFNYAKKEVFVYMNGVLSSYGTFSDAANLTHSNPIIFNGYLDEADKAVGKADSKVRFIRIYKTCLTYNLVVNNYIASYPDDEERTLLEDLNDEVNPILSQAYLKGDRTGIIKDEARRLFFSFISGQETRVTNTYIPDPVAVLGTYSLEYMDMKKEFPVDVDLLGNSSLSYPIKNYGMDIYDGEAWDTSRSIISKYYNMVYNADKIVKYRPWMDWDSYHLKSNYIDSSHCNNLIIAKLADKIFRLPYNWSDLSTIFPLTDPFKNYTVTRPDGTIDNYSRFPIYPPRLSIDGFPFLMRGDYTDSNNKEWEKVFCGLYTWNLKLSKLLYGMGGSKVVPNLRQFIYRSDSNGDSVHEQLRSGYCKFRDLTKEKLYLDDKGRVVSDTYRASLEAKEMFSTTLTSEYSWFKIGSSEGYLQTNGLYTWIKYGITLSDLNLSDSPVSKIYIGIAIDKSTSIKSNLYSDYKWTSIDISDGVLDDNGTYTLIQYASDLTGTNIGSSITNMNYIGFKYKKTKRLWHVGVDYFDKTGDPTEMSWRPGAELIMDWECREPKDLGQGHWEEYKNNQWIQTNNIISAKDLDANSTEHNKVLRFVWDKIVDATGDAKRTGTTLIDYWTSILDSNTLIQSLSDSSQTFSAIDKTKATVATNQHVDFLNAINWLSNSSDECFSNPKIFEKYFDLRSCLDYVLTCLTFCLTDSIGRNLTMISFDSESVKIAPGVMDRLPMRFYPTFYDIDTAFGTNVQGGLYSTPYVAWPYEIGTRYTPAEGAGQEYNCFGTLFFKRISKCYEAALCRRYLELRSGTVDPVDGKTNISAPFDYLSILLLYTKQIVGRVGERYFNEDAVYKYIGFDADPNETAKRNYITNARGNKVMFMKNFLKKRMDYIDSIMGYVPDTEDMAYLQHYSKGQMTLTFETNVAGYIRISFAQNQATSIYCDGINPVSISYNYPEVTQHILRIYNCGIITSMSGLANKDVRIARLNSMVNLKKLDLKGNPNFGMEVSTLEISKCKSLRTIDLTGCNGPTMFTPDISGCVLLEEFLVSNSSLGSCSFSNNLNLKTIDITGCPYFTVLDVSNLYKLTSLSYDLEKLISLNISNSSIIIDFSLPNTYNNLKALSIVNNKNITQLLFTSDSFINLVLLNISDCSKLTTVKDLFKNRLGYPALNKDFLARCPLLTTVESLFENSSLVTIPSLIFLGSNNIKSLKYLFKNCLKLQSIPNDVLDSLPMLEDITEIFYGSLLLYYTDITEVDENDEIIITGKNVSNVFLGNNIFSNCPKLKYITGAFLNSEIINIPTNIFLNSPLIQVADTCFAGILNNLSSFNNIKQYVKIPTSLFISCPNLLSISNIFKDSYINSVHNNIFNDCPKLITAYGVFNNTEISLIPSQIFLTSGYLTILTLSYAFASKNISSIYDNFLNNYPLLQNILNIFLSSGITSLPNGFLVTNKISKFKFSDLGIPNINTINYDIFNGSTYLTDISNLFSNTKIISTPNDFLSNNLAISNIDNLFENSIVENIGLNFLLFNNIINSDSIFLNRKSPINLGDNFMKNSLELLSCNNMFSGCTGITSTPINMMSNCPKLLSALNMFYNATSLATINTGLLSNVPLLSEVSGLFKNAIFVSIPDNVLITTGLLLFKFSTILTHKVLVSSQFLSGTNLLNINELYKDTLIETIQDNSFNGHHIINPIGVFTGSKIKTIGNNCFDLIKIQDASYMFSNENEQYIYSIGNDFMKNSDVENMEGMFYNNISIISIGSNFMGSQNKVTTVKDMFNGCVNLGLISSDFLSNSILLTNVLRLFNNCSKITSLSLNIFDNSTLINNIDSFISGTLIKSIPDNFMPNNTGLLNINSLLTGSLIESIGNNFMESSNINTLENTFLSSNLKTIGNNFLLNSKVLNANNAFKNCLLLTTIGDYFLKGNPLETANYCFDGDILLTNFGLDFFKNITTLLSAKYIFNNTNLSNLPNGFFDGCINLTTIDGLLFNNNIVTIPIGFLSGNTGLTLFRFSTFTNKDFTIPADFLQGCLGTVSINNLFTDSPITNIPDNFFHNLVSVNPTNLFTNSAIKTIGNNCFDSVQMSDASYMFSGTTHGAIETIGNNFMVNSKVQSLEATFKDSLTIKTIGNNFMGIGNNLTTLLDCFNGCLSLISIGSGFANNAPNLLSVVRVFFNCSSLLELPIGMLNNSPLLNNAMYFIGGTGITSIPDGFLPNNSGLSSLDSLTCGWNITHIGNDFMLGKTGLLSIDNLFKDNTKLISIGDNFLANGSVQTANGLFQNCTSIILVGDNFLSGNPLTSANHFFDGALAFTTTGDNFFTDFTNLVDITYFFNNTTISELPTDFLINCLKVNSLEGVFTNSKITSIPDEFLANNTGLTSLFYTKDGVSTSVFANTKIENIGDGFMYGSTGLTNIDHAFEGNTTINTIGKLFLAKSAVTTANYAFYNATGLFEIGSGVLNGCLLTSINSIFEGCSSLEKIGDYFEWFDCEDTLSYWYQLEDDSCKCNVAGQQAEVTLNVSVPYLESEYNSLDYVSDVASAVNIFKNTKMIRTPKGFLSKCSVSSAPVLLNVLSGSTIKYFNPDLFNTTNISNVTSLFNGTVINSIPKGFMEKNIITSNKTINWCYGVNNVMYIPKTFLKNCYIINKDIADVFIQSNIRVIQNDWLSWQWYSANTGTLSIFGSNLVNFPRNYSYKNAYHKIDRNFCVGITGPTWYGLRYGDTIIPEGYMYHVTSTYIDGFSQQFTDNIFKGVIPKTLFCNFSGKTGIIGVFLIRQANILSTEKGFLSQSFDFSVNNALALANFFNGCTNLRYVNDDIFKNIDLTSVTSVGIDAMFYNCVNIKKIPSTLSRFGNKITNTSNMFNGCTNLTNSNNELDAFLISSCYNNTNLIRCDLMFNNSGLTRLPEQAFVGCTRLINASNCFNNTKLGLISNNAFSDCVNMTNFNNAFTNTPITKIPKNLLSTGTLNNCDCNNMFNNCTSLSGAIPNDFLRYVKVSNAFNMFYKCSGLTGRIPSNFAIGGSGICTNFNSTFHSCSLEGFVDDIWNFTDFSKVTTIQNMFESCKITKLPSCFYTSSFDALTTASLFLSKSRIQTIEDNFLPNTPLLTDANRLCENCYSLVSVGSNFLNNAPKGNLFYYMFGGCTSLTTVGANYITNSPLLTRADYTFNGCNSLTGIIPANFLNRSTKITSFNSIFFNSKINGIESGNIFERLTVSCDFQNAFRNCTNFTGAFPTLWTLYPSNTTHGACFNASVNASNYASVPAGWR